MTDYPSEPHSAAPSSAPTPYSADQPAGSLRAPEGTPPNTPWIWLVVLIPVLQLLPVFFVDWAGFAAASALEPNDPAALGLIFSPAYVALILFSLIGVPLQILFAFLDWRELNRRGVPKPFHWAWILLVFVVTSAVYPIGRAIVAKRRTGTGLAPMWVAIGTILFGFAVGIWVTIAVIDAFLTTLTFAP